MAVSRPFLLIFSPFFRCFRRLDARNPVSGTKRQGGGSATVQNGRQKSVRRRSLKGWAVPSLQPAVAVGCGAEYAARHRLGPTPALQPVDKVRVGHVTERVGVGRQAVRLALDHVVAVPTPGNINVNLGVLARHFSTVTDRCFRVLVPVS